jgi:RimJ/RimL family protein N-acetyltransferase
MVLRPFQRSDFPHLIGWVESPDFLFQWAGPIFNYPLDSAQLERYYLLATGNPPTRRIYTAVLPEAGAAEVAVGHIELSNIDRRHRSATLARVLIGPAWRGRGCGQQMVTLALAIAFEELRLHRVDLYVFDFNQAAIGCYERAGLVREGRLRDARRVGDSYWSVVQMSLLEDEWAALRRVAPIAAE